MSTIATSSGDLAPIAAPVLIGALLNWGLFGALSIQVYIYYISFPKDRWIPKCLVYGVYLIDIAQTCLVTNDVFNAYAKHYGQLDFLAGIQNEWLAVPVLSGIISCAVQIYYAYRIRILSGSRWLQLLITALALTQGIAAIVAGVRAFIAGTFQALQTTAIASCGIWLAGSALCDIIIAVFMTRLLTRRDSKAFETHAIIIRLIRIIVETAVAATIDIILYFALPYADYHSCIATILAKLYSNSLLVIFNSRVRIVGGRNLGRSDNSMYDVSGSNPAQTQLVFRDPHSESIETVGSEQVEEEVCVETERVPMVQQNTPEQINSKKSLDYPTEV